jgi:hypothetical protein
MWDIFHTLSNTCQKGLINVLTTFFVQPFLSTENIKHV